MHAKAELELLLNKGERMAALKVIRASRNHVISAELVEVVLADRRSAPTLIDEALEHFMIRHSYWMQVHTHWLGRLANFTAELWRRQLTTRLTMLYKIAFAEIATRDSCVSTHCDPLFAAVVE